MHFRLVEEAIEVIDSSYNDTSDDALRNQPPEQGRASRIFVNNINRVTLMAEDMHE